MDIQSTEIYLITALIVSFLCFLSLILFRYPKLKIGNSLSTEKKEKPSQNILEIFDYLGTKIVHENGTYTVNQNGRVGFFKTWNDLPLEYKNMIKELDSRSLEVKTGEDYFLEIINGLYYLTMPGGKKIKYKSLNEIPSDIRKALGK